MIFELLEEKYLPYFDSFDCGIDKLNITKETLNNHMTGHIKVYILFDDIENKIIGYVSIRNSVLQSLKEGQQMPKIYPAVEIVSLAVDKEYRKFPEQEYGSDIMSNIIKVINKLKIKVGIKAIILASVDTAIGFYKNILKFNKLDIGKEMIFDDYSRGCTPMYMFI